LPQPDRDLEGAFEDYPLTRSEYISAMVHFYRGERSRADAWRSRLETDAERLAQETSRRDDKARLLSSLPRPQTAALDHAPRARHR